MAMSQTAAGALRSASAGSKWPVALLAAMMLPAAVAEARQITVSCAGVTTSFNRNARQTFPSRTEPKNETWIFDTESRKFFGRRPDGSLAEGGNYEISGGRLLFCRDLCGNDTRTQMDQGQQVRVELEFPRIEVDLGSGATAFLTAITSRWPDGSYFRQQTTFSGQCNVTALAELAQASR